MIFSARARQHAERKSTREPSGAFLAAVYLAEENSASRVCASDELKNDIELFEFRDSQVFS